MGRGGGGRIGSGGMVGRGGRVGGVWVGWVGLQGPSFTAHNSVEVLFVVF